MITTRSDRGMVTSPHHLASQSGLSVLRDGGTAIEAAVAVAAALTAVYPHMTGLGGDGFWLIAEPGCDPIGIQSAGATGAAVTTAFYKSHSATEIPARGPLAANTVAGAVDGWRAALEISARWKPSLSLERLFGDTIAFAENGIRVTDSQAELSRDNFAELKDIDGFAEIFLPRGAPPEPGQVFVQPALARTLRRLVKDGLGSFYVGALASDIAADLRQCGSPLTAEDLAAHRATSCKPLTLAIPGACLFNLPPPTQGLASLMILGMYARLGIDTADSFTHLHALIEATKLAYQVRDRLIGDPARLTEDPADHLQAGNLDRLAASIGFRTACAGALAPAGGDTVWLGVIDGSGRAVSYIQSLYFDFGSGIVLPETGILWQNRGCSFHLGEDGPRALRPRTVPFHTLCPAMARFADGRTMVFGAMGGDGQPQTLAAIFTRYALYGQDLQTAISAPRWIWGRTWGAKSTNVTIENRFDHSVIDALRGAGHDVDVTGDHSILMGHAGAIVRHDSGVLEGASDPRSDGAAVGW